jgi:hypothetical protein
MPAPPTPDSLAGRAARDPALLKRVLGNPNLRYKLPSSMLPVAQQRARVNAQAAKAGQSPGAAQAAQNQKNAPYFQQYYAGHPNLTPPGNLPTGKPPSAPSVPRPVVPTPPPDPYAAAKAAYSDPTTPLSGADFLGIANGIINSKYAPALGEIGRQEGAATARGDATGKLAAGIYDKLAKYQTSAATLQNTQQQAGAANVTGITGAASTAVNTAADQQRAQAARDAQIRGGGLDGGAGLALDARVAEEQGNIAARGQIAGNSMAENAQTNNAFLAGIGAATQQQGGEQQTNIQNTTASTDIASAKGGDVLDAVIKLRQQATDEYYTQVGLIGKEQAGAAAAAGKAAEVNKYGYSNGDWEKFTPAKRTQVIHQFNKDGMPDHSGDVTSATHGFTVAQWNAKTPDERRAIIAGDKPTKTDHSGDVTSATHGYTTAEWNGFSSDKRRQIIAADKKSGGRGAKGGNPYASTTRQVDAKNTIDKTVGLIKQYLAKGRSTGDIRQLLSNGVPGNSLNGTVALKAVPHDLLNAAFDVAVLGGLSPANVTALHHNQKLKVADLGYKQLPANYKPPVGKTVSNKAAALPPHAFGQ